MSIAKPSIRFKASLGRKQSGKNMLTCSIYSLPLLPKALLCPEDSGIQASSCLSRGSLCTHNPGCSPPKTQMPSPLDSAPFSNHKSSSEEHRCSQSVGVTTSDLPAPPLTLGPLPLSPICLEVKGSSCPSSVQWDPCPSPCLSKMPGSREVQAL